MKVPTRPIPDLSESDRARFWAKVDKTGECWLWTAAKTKGYACFTLGGRDNRQLVYGHRVAYTLERGPIPDGMVLDHRCYTPACVNPDHLEVVTQRVNSQRGRQVYANGRGECIHGHDITAAGALAVNRHGHKSCRECKKARRPAYDPSKYDPAKRRARYLAEKARRES